MPRRSAPPVVVLLFGLLLLAVAGILTRWLWDAWSLQRRAATVFVRTKGAVLDVRVAERRSGRRNSHVTWSVELDYRYDVGGRRHTSDREFFLGSKSSCREAAAAYAAAHPIGAAIARRRAA